MTRAFHIIQQSLQSELGLSLSFLVYLNNNRTKSQAAYKVTFTISPTSFVMITINFALCCLNLGMRHIIYIYIKIKLNSSKPNAIQLNQFYNVI